MNYREKLLIEIFKNNWKHMRHIEGERYWYFNVSSVILVGIISGFLESGAWKDPQYLLISLPLLFTVIAFVCSFFGSISLKLNYEILRIMYQTIKLIAYVQPDLIEYAHFPYRILKDIMKEVMCSRETKEQESHELSNFMLNLLGKICRCRGNTSYEIIREVTHPVLSVASLVISFYFYMLLTSLISSSLVLIIIAFNTILIAIMGKLYYTVWLLISTVIPIVAVVVTLLLLCNFIHRAEEQYKIRKEALEVIRKNKDTYKRVVNKLIEVGMVRDKCDEDSTVCR